MLTASGKVTSSRFETIVAKLERAVASEIALAADTIAAQAIDNAPRGKGPDAGALARSISSIQINDTHAAVIVQDEKGPWLEYGTATRAANYPDGYSPGGPYYIEAKSAWALHFQVHGQDVFAKAVHNHPGIFPHPYLTPAAENYAPKFIENLANLESRLK